MSISSFSTSVPKSPIMNAISSTCWSQTLTISSTSLWTIVLPAKEIRGFLEPLVTLAKVNNVANQRKVYAKLRDKAAVAKLFNKIGPRFAERPGGYLRVIKRGYRSGDKSPIAQVEFLKEEIEESPQEVIEEVTS